MTDNFRRKNARHALAQPAPEPEPEIEFYRTRSSIVSCPLLPCTPRYRCKMILSRYSLAIEMNIIVSENVILSDLPHACCCGISVVTISRYNMCCSCSYVIDVDGSIPISDCPLQEVVENYRRNRYRHRKKSR